MDANYYFLFSFPSHSGGKFFPLITDPILESDLSLEGLLNPMKQDVKRIVSLCKNGGEKHYKCKHIP